MATWGTFVSSIMQTLKQNFDDREITFEQAYHWTIICSDLLNLQHAQKRDTGLLLTTFVADIATDDIIKRRYVNLPARIFDLDLDAAVSYMCYYIPTDTVDDVPRILKIGFYRTNPSQANIHEGDPDQRATPRLPKFYREHNRLVLLGVSPMITKVEIGLMVANPDIKDIVPTDEMRFPPELMTILERHVIDLARHSLMRPATKLANDGSEREQKEAGPLPPAVSVNAPELNDANA